MYTYTFQMLHIELHIACIQTKFCQSCPHNKEGWAGLFWPISKPITRSELTFII